MLTTIIPLGAIFMRRQPEDVGLLPDNDSDDAVLSDDDRSVRTTSCGDSTVVGSDSDREDAMMDTIPQVRTGVAATRDTYPLAHNVWNPSPRDSGGQPPHATMARAFHFGGNCRAINH